MITIKKENEKICGKCVWFFLKGMGVLGICTYRPTRECWYSKECATPEHYVPKQQLRHYQAVLIQANRYRRDQNVPSIYRMPDPTELGMAIDFAVKYMRMREDLDQMRLFGY